MSERRREDRRERFMLCSQVFCCVNYAWLAAMSSSTDVILLNASVATLCGIAAFIGLMG